jgi:hypothetical protein
MSVYYSFIAGLPELEFTPEATFELPVQFMGKLEEQLSLEELEFARLLWFQKFHRKIALFFSGTAVDEPLPGFDAEAFHPEHELFLQLPCYLQKLAIWRERKKEHIPEMLVAQKLQFYYYGQLLGSENRFLRHWGELELNRLNFLAARRSEQLSADKQKQLIGTNEYYDLLLEFPVGHKIVHTEFSDANRLEAISEKPNYLEREVEMDRLRWDSIDDINQFEYFTVDVILGYLQKLLLLERWNNIFHPENPVVPVEQAEKMIKEKQV